jgi:hypothetical protein
MRADFLERVRSGGFLIVLAVTVFAAYMFVPPYGSPYATLVIGGHRGYYNSPWVGTLYGVVASTLLGLVGFYLVKNAVTRDYQTRVGQIIATTHTRKYLYILGKWASNVAVLAVILAVLTVMAPTMQLVRAEDSNIDLWALVAPIWFLGLPSLCVISAIAVLFESVPFLRGGLGNVAYFFVWGPGLLASEGSLLVARASVSVRNDFGGLSRSIVSIRELLAASGMDISHGGRGVIVPLSGTDVVRFTWSGIDWTAGIFLERLEWIGAAIAIALIASLPFDRFDPARRRLRGRSPGRRNQWLERVRNAVGNLLRSPGGQTSDRPADGIGNTIVQLTPLPDSRPRSRWAALYAAELRLMLKGRKWLWNVAAALLVVATLTVPLDITYRYLFLAAWLWPILLWSAMGNRERQHETHQIVFAVAHPLRRQLSAIWMAGFSVAVLFGGGIAVRLVAAGRWGPSFAWVAGAAFIPSLALALGTWSNGSRLFEITYMIWWYLGPVSRIPAWDFTGVTAEASATATPLAYLVASVVLLGMAAIGRRRQLQV